MIERVVVIGGNLGLVGGLQDYNMKRWISKMASLKNDLQIINQIHRDHEKEAKDLC